MAADEVTVLLTARDNLSSSLRDVRSTVRQLERDMEAANREFRQTGDPAALARYRALRQQWDQASAAQRRLQAELARTNRRMRDLQNQGTRSADRVRQAWQRAASVFQNGMVAGLSAGALVMFGKQSVEAFAKVEDASAALRTTFGDSGESMVQWAQASGDALNLSQAQALEAAQAFATFGSSAGLTGKALETFSTDLVTRAADMASYFGGSVSDALDAIRSGLAGETEPLKRYAVMLDDATMRQKALSMGLVKTTSQALAPQTKALVAQALILERTASAAGDVARTSDSMGNRIKDAQQQIEDFKVTTGETIAVALGPMLDKLNAAFGVFNGLPKPVQQVSIAITGLGAAALIATPSIVSLNTALASRGGLIGVARMNWKKAAVGAAAFFAAMAVGNTVGKGDIAGTWRDLGGEIDSIQDPAERTGAAIRAIVQPGWWGTSLNAIDGVGDALLGAFGVDLRTVVEGANEEITAFDKHLTELVSSGNPEEAARQYEAQRAAIEAYGGSVEELNRLLPDYSAAIGDTADAAGGARVAYDAMAVATRRVRTAITGMGRALTHAENVLARREAIRSYKDALKQFVKDPSKDTAAAVASAMLTAAQSMKDPQRQQRWILRNWKQIKSAAADPSIPASIRRGLRDVLGEVVDAAKDAKDAVLDLDGMDARVNVIVKRISQAGFAGGGLVTGPGTATSDSIPAMLSNGEYVVQAAAVRAIGVDALERINAGDRTVVQAAPVRAIGVDALERINAGDRTVVQAAPLRAIGVDALERINAGDRTVVQRVDRMPVEVPPLVVRGGDGASAPTGVGATVNIGTVNATRDVDVEGSVLQALMRADRISRERR